MKAREERCTKVEVVHNNVAWSGGLSKHTWLPVGFAKRRIGCGPQGFYFDDVVVEPTTWFLDTRVESVSLCESATFLCWLQFTINEWHLVYNLMLSIFFRGG